MNDVILAKYGEIALKGANKRVFEKELVKTVRLAVGTGFDVYRMQSTLYVRPLHNGAEFDAAYEAAYNGAYEKVKKIFGIATVCKAFACEKNFQDIVKTTFERFSEISPAEKANKTFYVKAKRADKAFAMTSPEICRELGHEILEKFPQLRVDCETPDFTVTIDVRDKNAFVYGEKVRGAGGLPVGTGGNALLLLSGGIDSPVAGYLMAKRGVKIAALHFESPPYTSERARMKVEKLVEKMEDYCGHIRFFCEYFTERQEQIRRDCPEEYFTLIMRREMMRKAVKIARERGYQAIITGESLGQVASQTIEALNSTDAVSDLPVLRPLISFDKYEIMEIARKIGTLPISELPYEDCCTVFTPRHPKLRPKLEDVEKAELFLPSYPQKYDTHEPFVHNS